MIRIPDWLKRNGASLAESWGREFWYCEGGFLPFNLNLGDVRSNWEKGELTNYAAYRDGARVTEFEWGTATILIREIERYFPWIANMGAELEAYLKTPYSDTSLIFSPATASGPPVHRDPYQLLIFQLSGSKRWKLWDKDHKEVPEQILQQGDVFHLPAGRLHMAVPCSESLHFAVKFPAEIF